ncbi:hypothetical protein GCM10009715_38910 [Paeniglutamicibacter psychrophenolicus]|uniref:Transcriptional regulator with XRE-family HTH domain n=1 Tax=Paeniglutamicibacter psychrophenolicus TaxID=257454 RepID=A0ABS4WIF7_9MICC|nr:helix-turn-helix transcriptional regulator [Paeniglutamicibacter psychrophenolicus]MBP2375987.1 transcriptional regulator with XRE-family HTH domain [Paeniglutamicibacter psychrophenolicus]
MPSIDVKNAKVLSQIIKAAREGQGVQAQDLADRLGLTPQYISKLESGTSTLFATRLFRVLNRLNIKMTLSYEPKKSDDSHG